MHDLVIDNENIIDGRGGSARDNKVYNNIFFNTGESAINFDNEHNEADGNLYAGLPANPSISPLVSLWKGFAKPLATLALAGVALGSLFHYVTKGPNEVSKEIEDEIEREDKEEAK